MRRALLVGLLLAGACAAPRAGSKANYGPKPARPLFGPAVEVADPNLILVVSEAVPDPGDEGVSFTKVFIDDREVGRTEVARRSEEHELKLKLPAGNQPIRLEHWILPAVGEWTRLDDGRQPRVRFVRVEDGTIARLELHFSEGEASNTLRLSREPAAR
jgi:hypothetical protein